MKKTPTNEEIMQAVNQWRAAIIDETIAIRDLQSLKIKREEMEKATATARRVLWDLLTQDIVKS